jgi:hypothetical protein
VNWPPTFLKITKKKDLTMVDSLSNPQTELKGIINKIYSFLIRKLMFAWKLSTNHEGQ